jgi:hypothetical protein
MPHEGETTPESVQPTGSPSSGGLTGSSLVVQETSLMNESADGVITVDPGDREVILRWDDNAHLGLHALGANDSPEMWYILKLDNEIVARTASPLGTLVNPYSFTDNLGEPVQAPSGRIEYEVWNVGNQSRDMGSRAFIEVLE